MRAVAVAQMTQWSLLELLRKLLKWERCTYYMTKHIFGSESLGTGPTFGWPSRPSFEKHVPRFNLDKERNVSLRYREWHAQCILTAEKKANAQKTIFQNIILNKCPFLKKTFCFLQFKIRNNQIA